jgi:hypothetical protein
LNAGLQVEVVLDAAQVHVASAFGVPDLDERLGSPGTVPGAAREAVGVLSEEHHGFTGSGRVAAILRRAREP